MEQKEGIHESNTLGIIRLEIIKNSEQLAKSGDARNMQMLRFNNERYYETLEDGSEAQICLKKQWDKLAVAHREDMKQWKIQYDKADYLDKTDLWSYKQNLEFNYEYRRYIESEINLLNYKTYWTSQEIEYSLE